MVDVAVHIVCDAVIADIHQKEQVFSADRFLKGSFAFAAAKAGSFHFQQIVIFTVALKGRICLYFVIVDGFTEFNQVIIDSFAHFLRGRKGDDL